MKRSFVCLALVILLSLSLVLPTNSFPLATGALQSDSVSSHWVQGIGYRDELNHSDIDYQNFWTDNAGKILTMAEITGGTQDAGHALQFLEDQGLGRDPYLPEVFVNSSVINSGSAWTNRIVELKGVNGSGLESLSVGDYYAGQTVLGYIGADRILVNGTIYSSASSTVFRIPDGLAKRSFFNTPDGMFYEYLNATVSLGDPYIDITLQVMPLNRSISSDDVLYLQVFSSQGQFDNSSLYASAGNFVENLVYDNGSPATTQDGMIIPFSKSQSVLTEDSVAVNFEQGTAYDYEHWYHDGAFGGLSWIGVAYNSTQDSAGVLSSPPYIQARIYPIQHMGYRLINETAKYIATNPENEAVSPPVGFGFVAYGLALAAKSNTNSATLSSLAESYWNYYYTKYNNSSYSTPYARAINTFALAGFELYGCNTTVESFTRDFIGNTSGSSIEEYGWAAAALHRLYECTGTRADESLYQRFVDSFGTSGTNFILVTGANIDLYPSYTFQFGEAASGLLIGGVPYNDPVVLKAMNAVYQSNVSGVVLNQPFRGDLGNTETLPAYMLATWLFAQNMSEATGGYFVSSLHDANLTSISFAHGSLTIQAYGGDTGGSITVVDRSCSANYSIPAGLSTIAVIGCSAPWVLIVAIASSIGAATLAVLYVRRQRKRITRDGA